MSVEAVAVSIDPGTRTWGVALWLACGSLVASYQCRSDSPSLQWRMLMEILMPHPLRMAWIEDQYMGQYCSNAEIIELAHAAGVCEAACLAAGCVDIRWVHPKTWHGYYHSNRMIEDRTVEMLVHGRRAGTDERSAVLIGGYGVRTPLP